MRSFNNQPLRSINEITKPTLNDDKKKSNDIDSLSFKIEGFNRNSNDNDTLNIGTGKKDNELLKFSSNYKLQREIKMSGSFGQAKIFVTVDKDSLGETLLSLCRRVQNDFKKYPNIIICIYSNDEIGNKLAKGFSNNVNLIEKSRSWLAMYSFNKVEGEYFDSEPGEYLGVRK